MVITGCFRISITWVKSDDWKTRIPSRTPTRSIQKESIHRKQCHADTTTLQAQSHTSTELVGGFLLIMMVAQVPLLTRLEIEHADVFPPSSDVTFHAEAAKHFDIAQN